MFLDVFNKKIESITPKKRTVKKPVNKNTAPKIKVNHLTEKQIKTTKAPITKINKVKPILSKNCVNIRLTGVTGDEIEYKGVILSSETVEKWKTTPVINYVLIVSKNGDDDFKPYIKMINDCYCQRTLAFDCSSYDLSFNKEKWLKETKPKPRKRKFT
jgi:hypothetical protein